jgi:hypothetical protein
MGFYTVLKSFSAHGEGFIPNETVGVLRLLPYEERLLLNGYIRLATAEEISNRDWPERNKRETEALRKQSQASDSGQDFSTEP